jgi:hypothetical protein
MGQWSPVLELRNYVLRAGARDTLIELFDRELLESQDAVGMHVIGQFRVLGHPDRFIWLRGFPDMPTRGSALAAFYDGPVWERHREAANATMIAWDNVFLLRPARPWSGFALHGTRPSPGSTASPDGIVVSTIYHLARADQDDFAAFFEDAVAPTLVAAGASILALFVTEHAPNNFPRYPVREGERVLVSFTAFDDETAYERHTRALAEDQEWREPQDALVSQLAREPEVWRLRPTARSWCTAETPPIDGWLGSARSPVGG